VDETDPGFPRSKSDFNSYKPGGGESKFKLIKLRKIINLLFFSLYSFLISGV
jgi:hypothetical protein